MNLYVGYMQKKHRGLSPHANYTDRVAAALLADLDCLTTHNFVQETNAYKPTALSGRSFNALS